MLCSWEGNRRSGVALAVRHRLSGLSTYGLNGQCVGDEHPTYTLHLSMVHLPYLFHLGDIRDQVAKLSETCPKF